MFCFGVIADAKTEKARKPVACYNGQCEVTRTIMLHCFRFQSQKQGWKAVNLARRLLVSIAIDKPVPQKSVDGVESTKPATGYGSIKAGLVTLTGYVGPGQPFYYIPRFFLPAVDLADAFDRREIDS